MMSLRFPTVPNAQANPQKNLPNITVKIHTAKSAAMNELNSIGALEFIWLNMFLIPENADVNAEGNNTKNNNWIIPLVHIRIRFFVLGFICFIIYLFCLPECLLYSIFDTCGTKRRSTHSINITILFFQYIIYDRFCHAEICFIFFFS